jgi:hypothetical protein
MQIEQISHNMLIDKVCEEYPEIHMQDYSMSINCLKLYNGKFPNTKASVVHFSTHQLMVKEIING